MAFQSEPGTIRWKLHCNSTPQTVYDALATDDGRAHFWAESAVEKDGLITFIILGYEPYQGRVISRIPPTQFSVEYFGTIVEFSLKENNNGGVSVLMAMKAWVDHGADLRNHDKDRTWAYGYVDN